MVYVILNPIAGQGQPLRLKSGIEAALKEGLPPGEFPAVEALREANTLARKILRLTVRVDATR